ncbi:tyrosinase [Hirsutella rhossiliensis]|uniref:Tyrosinase n=1 Tax=Hirsutella rhossiliensis TaxID=111463 RepID=A0A9P8SG32_9HYPO|nr:tyrosinase [Hirsutella rhossiliensis]KAH0961548.1 tyrosinase [Hirsutella rhossiliensis]
MLSPWFSLVLPLVSLCLAHAPPGYGGQGIEPPAAFRELEARYSASSDELTGAYAQGACTQRNMGIRRPWHHLAMHERRDYIRAVKCLHNKRSTADPRVAPGNRNRMDDFTSSHIKVATLIHSSGYFLPWHRYFVWAYEKSLREECHYQGYQPYWDFSRWSDNQLASPVFDGSPGSLGGDGEAIGDQTRVLDMPALPVEVNFTVFGGTGGGCVKTGPFAHFNISLGPVVSLPPVNPVSDPLGLEYNPRCLTRSFYPPASILGLNWANVTRLLQTENIHQFRPLMESDDNGVHISAHGAIGGEAVDFFSSPGEPAFFLLHAQIDRLWTIWQGQDWAGRRDGLDGTATFRNLPPSPNVTTETLMDMGYAGGHVPVGDAMSPIDGPFCYKYE